MAMLVCGLLDAQVGFQDYFTAGILVGCARCVLHPIHGNNVHLAGNIL